MNPGLETCFTWRGAEGPSLRALVADTPARLDPRGVQEAFGERPATGTACIAGATRLWSPTQPSNARPLLDALTEACAQHPGRIALALSGGVDSAVLAALLRDRVVAYTLAPEMPEYSEVDEAARIATSLGLEWRRVHVSEHDFITALPEVITACETPLYNLHPVSRHLLARAVRADGFDVLLTGDGADEVFRGTTSDDYLPIVGALTRAAGLTPLAPFLAPAVIASVTGIPRDPGKQPLRALACALGVPEAIAMQPKHPRYAPAMDLTPHLDLPTISALARSLGRAPDLTSDRARVGWTTLALFARAYPGLDLSCAA